MSLKEFPSVQNRIEFLSEYVQKPEAVIFNTDEIYSYLSDENKEFLSPLSNHFETYLNCLTNVIRWKEHPYQKLTQKLNDTDYDHTLEMLKISRDIKNLNFNSINFSDVELITLIHDGGEIITDDISANHIATNQPLADIKKLEPRVFVSCVLNQLKEKEFFILRKKIRNLYKRYESRHNNFSDTESHLVKLIDIFQGDNFGLENVYSKTKLDKAYGDDIFTSPDNFLSERINKEISQLKIVLDSLKDPQEKSKLFFYYKNQQFVKFSNPDYGFQKIFDNFSPTVCSIGQTLPSF
ncbi:MAG: hypothetical protein WCT51_03130 [Candidatus Shapirobacteria bacterium]|jgi:5'-deoxynucleotidase YfbR-like HD superfamily hydrolase